MLMGKANLVPGPARVDTSLSVSLGRVNTDFDFTKELSTTYFASCRNRSVLRRTQDALDHQASLFRLDGIADEIRHQSRNSEMPSFDESVWHFSFDR